MLLLLRCGPNLEVVLEWALPVDQLPLRALKRLGSIRVSVLIPIAIRRQLCAVGLSKLVVVNLQLEWVHVPIYSQLNVLIPWGGNPRALTLNQIANGTHGS